MFYLIPGAIFNDSDVTSIKPPFTSIIFFFFTEKIFKNEKLTDEISTYPPGLNPPLPSYAPYIFVVFSRPLPPSLRTEFMDGLKIDLDYMTIAR